MFNIAYKTPKGSIKQQLNDERCMFKQQIQTYIHYTRIQHV